jgi:hypothetical protein
MMRGPLDSTAAVGAWLTALGIAACGGGGGGSRDAAVDVAARADATDGPAADAERPPAASRDVNGDGFDDLVIGAPGLLGGTARVFLGGAAAALDATSDGTLLASGVSLALVDFNGDGFADMVAGTPADGVGGLEAGRVDVFFGAAGAVVDGEADWTVTGAAGDRFGFAVAGAGDLNGDGFGDLVAGAPGDTLTLAGRALVFLGGLDPDETADATLLGAAAGDGFGWAVAGVPDADGDGFDDVLVGAPEAGGTMTVGDGAVQLYRGGPGEAFDPTADATWTGAAEELGTSVLGLDDVDGDGLGDFAAGAPRAASGVGRVAVWFGASPIDTTADGDVPSPDAAAAFFGASLGGGDFDGDGHNDLSVGSQFAGRVDVYLGAAGTSFDVARDAFVMGASTSGVAAAVGDANGDGFDDLAIGLPSASEVHVYFGGALLDDATAEGTLAGAAAEQFGAAMAGTGDPATRGREGG